MCVFKLHYRLNMTYNAYNVKKTVLGQAQIKNSNTKKPKNSLVWVSDKNQQTENKTKSTSHSLTRVTF